jgi:hypothetical protein
LCDLENPVNEEAIARVGLQRHVKKKGGPEDRQFVSHTPLAWCLMIFMLMTTTIIIIIIALRVIGASSQDLSSNLLECKWTAQAKA